MSTTQLACHNKRADCSWTWKTGRHRCHSHAYTGLTWGVRPECAGAATCRGRDAWQQQLPYWLPAHQNSAGGLAVCSVQPSLARSPRFFQAAACLDTFQAPVRQPTPPPSLQDLAGFPVPSAIHPAHPPVHHSRLSDLFLCWGRPPHCFAVGEAGQQGTGSGEGRALPDDSQEQVVSKRAPERAGEPRRESMLRSLEQNAAAQRPLARRLGGARREGVDVAQAVRPLLRYMGAADTPSVRRTLACTAVTSASGTASGSCCGRGARRKSGEPRAVQQGVLKAQAGAVSGCLEENASGSSCPPSPAARHRPWAPSPPAAAPARCRRAHTGTGRTRRRPRPQST